MEDKVVLRMREEESVEVGGGGASTTLLLKQKKSWRACIPAYIHTVLLVSESWMMSPSSVLYIKVSNNCYHML